MSCKEKNRRASPELNQDDRLEFKSLMAEISLPYRGYASLDKECVQEFYGKKCRGDDPRVERFPPLFE